MNSVLERGAEFLSKLKFCVGVSTSFAGFLRLVIFTKKFRGISDHPHRLQGLPKPEADATYRLQLLQQIRPVVLRTFRGDLNIFYEVFWRRVYDLPEFDFSRVQSIVDVGANTGMSVLFFHLKAPQARIIAVEPDGQNYALLQKNLSPEIAAGTVVPVQAAASVSAAPLYLKQEAFGYNSHVSATNTGAVVASVPLEVLFQQQRLEVVDLLKIDIEGFEELLFAENILWLNRVRQVVLEIHSAAAFAVVHAALTQYKFSMRQTEGAWGEAGIYVGQRLLRF